MIFRLNYSVSSNYSRVFIRNSGSFPIRIGTGDRVLSFAECAPDGLGWRDFTPNPGPVPARGQMRTPGGMPGGLWRRLIRLRLSGTPYL